MNEIDVRLRARKFVAEANAGEIPTMPAYAKQVGARIRSESLGRGESGNTMRHPNGTYIITVNQDESEERKRFTICHEIGHIVLGLPTHHENSMWAGVKRHPNEMACDWFASELLMPQGAFEKRVPAGEPTVGVIEELGEVFGASFPATASRYASLVSFPCGYAFMSGETVIYATVNAAFRSKGIRIEFKCPIPHGSVARRLRGAKERGTDTDQIPQEIWLSNCGSGYDLSELARHNSEFDETVSLIWCTEDDLPRGEVDRFNRHVEEDGGLEELDGNISWEKHGPRVRR
jgi:Zn-dependent peptidase ImmA (M78 family)